MKRLSLVLLSCSTALQGPPRVTSCTRRPATDDAAEVPAVIDDETLERELPIDFGSSGTQWTFEWPLVGDEPWSVRDVAGGGAMFAACHIASGALGAPSFEETAQRFGLDAAQFTAEELAAYRRGFARAVEKEDQLTDAALEQAFRDAEPLRTAWKIQQLQVFFFFFNSGFPTVAPPISLSATCKILKTLCPGRFHWCFAC